MRVFIAFFIILMFSACKKNSSTAVVKVSDPTYSLSLNFERNNDAGLDSFDVIVSLSEGNKALPGKTLSINVPKGSVNTVHDNEDGTYTFTVTPTASGVYPVTVTYQQTSITREALVFDEILSSAGQPLSVPGEVNTEGYEDGITVTPDGNYLFVQYGPIYMSGLLYLTSICPPDVSYSLYNLGDCPGAQDYEWVFNTLGPYNTAIRPSFPTGSISNGVLQHINLVVPTVANKIALFPTVFYGFKRQSDGSFKEPFKVSFNDARGTNGPFGLSFHMTSATSAEFALAWNNYFNDLGDDKPDIYAGTLTMNQTTNLGEVVYSGDLFQSISPNISPVTFSSHTGVQGNPHLYYDNAGAIQSVWTDDEQTSHDLSVYTKTSGTFPNGTWSLVSLPSTINTVAEESQPFFTGTKLYLRRGDKIVSHNYLGSGGSDYHLNASWGPEVVILRTASSGLNEMITVGEPTIATYNGKTYLYFAYGTVRAISSSGRRDINLNAGFVELP